MVERRAASQTGSLTPNHKKSGIDPIPVCAKGVLALLLPITWAADVQMVHARPFWTSTLQDLSNGIKNTSMQGVLTLAIKL